MILLERYLAEKELPDISHQLMTTAGFSNILGCSINAVRISRSLVRQR